MAGAGRLSAHEARDVDLTDLTWVDLAILVLLAFGIFIGFAQGLIRYLLGAVSVVLAFVLAAQLRGPVSGIFGVWEAFPPEGRDLFFFVVLFVGLVIGFWFLIRTFYGRTRLPIARQLDEIGGAILGFVFVVVLISFHLVVLDSFYRVEANAEPEGPIGAYYTAINDSVIIGFLRDTVIPTVGFAARPFVPADIADLLRR